MQRTQRIWVACRCFCRMWKLLYFASGGGLSSNGGAAGKTLRHRWAIRQETAAAVTSVRLVAALPNQTRCAVVGLLSPSLASMARPYVPPVSWPSIKLDRVAKPAGEQQTYDSAPQR